MRLNENFIDELFKLMLRKKSILELCIEHLQYHYLPEGENARYYKEIFKQQVEYHVATGKLMTIGMLSEEMSAYPKAMPIINNIKIADTIDEDSCVIQLEQYIKRKFFVEFYDQIGESYEKGNREDAYKLIESFNESFSKFKLKDNNTYTKIIGQYEDRITIRKNKDHVKRRKIPTGIPDIDDITHGGIDKQDIGLIMAESGVGKSYALRWFGLSAARRGFRVVHVQVEGSKQECVDAYDSGIAGTSIGKIEYGNLNADELKKVRKALKDIENGKGEIFVKAFETFDNGGMRDVHTYCGEIVDEFGEIDLLLLDYIDETDPQDGKRYSTSNDGERKRREATAKKFKNTCVEYNCAGWTATQSHTLTAENKKDPDFVQTRFNISEFKGLVKPFSYFITLNQTRDEKEAGVIRLYPDKIRKYKNAQQSIPIATNYGAGRFYSHQKTLKKFE